MFWTIRGMGVMMVYWVFWHLTIQNDHNKNSPSKPAWILDEMRLRFSDIAISVALENEELSHSLNKATLHNAAFCLLTPFFTKVNFKSCLVTSQPSLMPYPYRLQSHHSLHNCMFSATSAASWVCILFELENVQKALLAKEHWFCFQFSKESLQRRREGSAEQLVLFMNKAHLPLCVWCVIDTLLTAGGSTEQHTHLCSQISCMPQ